MARLPELILGQGLLRFFFTDFTGGSLSARREPRRPSVIQGSDGTPCRHFVWMPPQKHTRTGTGTGTSTDIVYHSGLFISGGVFLCFLKKDRSRFCCWVSSNNSLTIRPAGFQRLSCVYFWSNRRHEVPTRRRAGDPKAHTCPKISHAKAWAAHKTRALSEIFIRFSYFLLIRIVGSEL